MLNVESHIRNPTDATDKLIFKDYQDYFARYVIFQPLSH